MTVKNLRPVGHSGKQSRDSGLLSRGRGEPGVSSLHPTAVEIRLQQLALDALTTTRRAINHLYSVVSAQFLQWPARMEYTSL
jgi:hypothetical protein